MMNKKLISAFCALLLLGGCSGANIRSSGDGMKSEARERRPLTRDEAANRSKQIRNVSYVLWFGLTDELDRYDGRAVINFELRPKARDHGSKIFLDFDSGELKSLNLNGKPVPVSELSDSSRFDGRRIHFKISDLQPGANRVEIAFNQKYADNGNGLHRFKDPVDSKIYLYSNFEPYYANRMFPCFDQPDLKASFELTVDTPDDWVVIANTLEREVTEVQGKKVWAFPPTPLLPTYIFALHAGHYTSWKADADGIPLRLFSRKSLAKHVDPKEWFDVTRRGLAYFNEEFGYPYPYAKYDQIIVPEFNAGAMENAAAVTFTEDFVFRGRVTTEDRMDRAETILHEMAHMWFGNLVTMRWWNGLWLNESFATYAAARATDQATTFKGVWQGFFKGSKQWAYREDQWITTHPIEVPVPDTDHADAIFDGITYGKGASVLKQLNYFLGDEDYREGLQRYFEKFALSNTTLADFMRMLSEASDRDLSQWQRKWLLTSGLNTVRAEWACDADPETGKGRVSRFKLIQQGEELRSHRTEIVLMNLKGGTLAPNGESLPMTYSTNETIISGAVGRPCPDAVFPNYRDYDFVKVELDPTTLASTQQNLSRIEDPFLRQMLWHTLWEMVTDAKMKAQDYAELVLKHAASEKDIQVLSRILGTAVIASERRVHALQLMGSPELREKYADRFETFFRTHLQSSAAGSDAQLTWFEAFVQVAKQPASLNLLRGLLSGKSRLPGLIVDQDRRWQIIWTLSRVGAPEVQDTRELIAAELLRDNTEMGQTHAVEAETAFPDAANKASWMARFTQKEKTELTTAKLRAAMANYRLIGQEPLTAPAIDAYFEELPKIALLPDDEFISGFARSLFPNTCEESIVKRATQLLEKHEPKLPAQVVKSVKIARQENEKCLAARKLSLGN